MMERHVYDTMARQEDTHWWYRAVRQLVSRTLQSESGGRRLRVLDVGCGTGGGMASIAGRLPDSLLVGIDVADIAVWYSSRRRVGCVARASANHLPFRDGSFDAVTLIDVLYMLGHEDRAAVGEAYRVLREGGLLVANTAAFEWLRGKHDTATRTRHRYRKEEIRRLLTGGGFEVTRLLYWNTLLLPAVAFVRNVLRPAPAKGGPPMSDIRSASRWLNSLLTRLLSIDVMLAEKIGFPLGSSVYCLARKRSQNPVGVRAPSATAAPASADRATESVLKTSPHE